MNYVAIPGIKEQYRSQCVPVITSDGIIDAVCNHFELTLDDLKAKCRIKEYVHARHVAFFFLRKHTSMTLKSMAAIFNMDHTTVIHGLEKLGDIMETEPVVRSEVERLQIVINEIGMSRV